MHKPPERDLTKGLFATIDGVKMKQFGHDIYASTIKFKDLQDFLEVFQNVQRDTAKAKVRSIKRYILSGVKNPEAMRFFSAITVTCKGTIYHDPDKQRVAIDTNSRMSVNDGQHRFEAIKQAIQELEKEVIENGREEEENSRLRQQLEDLKNMGIAVIIFDGLEEREEKQLFHDLNNLATRPSGSANIRFSQNDLFARMARELAVENRYLSHYGVEMDKKSIHKNNPNIMLLTTLHTTVHVMLGLGRYSKVRKRDILTEENFDSVKQKLSDTFDKLFYSLPSDINVKGKYIVDKNYAIMGLVKFIHYARTELKIEDKLIFNAIENTDFSDKAEVWSAYGGGRGRSGNVTFSSSHGIKGVMKALSENLEKEKKNWRKSS